MIVQIYDYGRFDKECGTGCGLIVDHTRDIAFVLRFHGNAVAVVAHGNDSVLEICAVTAVHHVCELAVDFFVGKIDASADVL